MSQCLTPSQTWRLALLDHVAHIHLLSHRSSAGRPPPGASPACLTSTAQAAHRMSDPGDMNVEMVNFFGLKVPPKKPVHQPVIDDGHEFEVIHVTNVALGENPADGPHVVKILHEGQEVVLGTLQKGVAYQFGLDFCISEDVDFLNTGSSPVFLSGYRTKSAFEMSYEVESESEEEEEGEEEEEEAPEAVPLEPSTRANGVPQRKAAKVAAAKTRAELSKDEEARARARPEPLVPGDLAERRSEAAAARKQERAARRMGVQPLVPADEEDEDEEEDEDYDEGEDEDEDEEMEMDEEDMLEQEQARQRLADLKAGKGNAFPANEDEDEDEEDEDEDEGEDEGGLPRLDSDDIIGAFAGEDEDEDDEDDEDEDEEDEDEDEDEEEEEEEEQQAAAATRRPAPEPFAAPQIGGSNKRPPTTPQPQQQKRQKTDEQRVPASAPPKVQAGKDKGAAGGQADKAGADGEFERALMAFLRAQGGPVPLSALGTKVKRPEGVSMKLKAFITTHSAHFKFDDKSQLVSLA